MKIKDFDYYLDKIGEIGFVEESVYCLTYISGLPNIHLGEVVIFESGDLGYTLSLNRDQVLVLLLTETRIKVGSKAVRTGENIKAPVGNEVLGRLIDPLGRVKDYGKPFLSFELKPVDVSPPNITQRKQVEKPLETGVTIVDLVIPLAKGQRELVIGDRKTGKTEFLLHTLLTQALKGTVCIYAVIGQKQIDINKLYEFFEAKGIRKNTLIVASSSSDPAGQIFLTPYTAMTIAEFYKDKGMDVLLILDDMTTHARMYREISLLAKRFPGRASYPGDIFYIHAKLIERAGNFNKGSITCLPVAEAILGDLSGYLQTNLMAMTDGHIFFDTDFFNQGKRPAINPFLSVTRVGHQVQSMLQKDISRELSSFLVGYERMKQFLHFGAEVGDTARRTLALGAKIDVFFNQSINASIPLNANIFILSALWSGVWNETDEIRLRQEMEQVVLVYQTDDTFKKQIDDLLNSAKTFSEVVNYLRRNTELITGKIVRSKV
ncbi:hypothetical protein A2159_02440 [Candidatus Woesebacteria bacterium RBG_13_34_9]|uniref:ATPase F1/V1/A1 complex alpha/beta subunit nucleotide-binding domain-containing protein n=1 Tax=Candidatus Woesebacteria bacterium RBG_13_34_9 TaxID=1802477 RepID=A0A1F7X6H5_9BACT|nr:MAG: hypothetical protein A2159_02440 [Candidatus Woesebacteria bacterium RBG_13_34_9]